MCCRSVTIPFVVVKVSTQPKFTNYWGFALMQQEGSPKAPCSASCSFLQYVFGGRKDCKRPTTCKKSRIRQRLIEILYSKGFLRKIAASVIGVTATLFLREQTIASVMVIPSSRTICLAYAAWPPMSFILWTPDTRHGRRPKRRVMQLRLL